MTLLVCLIKSKTFLYSSKICPRLFYTVDHTMLLNQLLSVGVVLLVEFHLLLVIQIKFSLINLFLKDLY